jgi:hypothetical protein
VAKAAAAAGTLPKVEEGGEEEDEDMQVDHRWDLMQ